MRSATALIFSTVLLSSCTVDFNDTARLKDKQMAEQIVILQDSMSSRNLKLEEIETHHYAETFTCGKANGKYFMIRGGKAYIGHEEKTGYEISTCCITLAAHYQYEGKPEITTEFSKEAVDKNCSVLSSAPNLSASGEPITIADRYPAPWIEDAKITIVKALAEKKISGCGQFKYRQSFDRSSEYLVYCTRDGSNWTSYIVFPRELMSSDVMGPYPTDPTLPP